MIIPFKTSIYWDFAGGHPWKADAAVTTRRLQVWLGCRNSPKTPVIYDQFVKFIVPAYFWPAELAQCDSYCFPANMAPLRISTPMCWRRGRGPRWFSLGWHLFAHWIPKKNCPRIYKAQNAIPFGPAFHYCQKTYIYIYLIIYIYNYIYILFHIPIGISCMRMPNFQQAPGGSVCHHRLWWAIQLVFQKMTNGISRLWGVKKT